MIYFEKWIELAVETGQDLKRIGFKDQSWLGLKTRSRKYSWFSFLILNLNQKLFARN